MVPQEQPRRSIGPRVQSMREKEGLSGQPPVVVADETNGQRENNGQRRKNPGDARSRSHGRFCFSCKPPKEPPRHRDTEEQSLIGPGVGQDGDPQGEQQSIACARAAHNSRDRTQHQRATGGCDSSTPVAVDPIAGNSELQRNQHSAEKRPPGRKPGLQHPKNRGAHRGNAQEHADPWMSKQLTERQDGPLPQRILRRIGREPIHVKRLEAHPHGMGRIGQTAVGQRVTKQQIAVLIMDSRNGHWQLRQKSKPGADDDEEKGDDRQRLALRQTGKKRLDGVECSWRQAR